MTGRATGWRWLLTGTIRVPVPVGAAAVLLAGAWIYASGGDSTLLPAPAPTVSLADFRPVAQIEPVILGGQR